MQSDNFPNVVRARVAMVELQLYSYYDCFSYLTRYRLNIARDGEPLNDYRDSAKYSGLIEQGWNHTSDQFIFLARFFSATEIDFSPSFAIIEPGKSPFLGFTAALTNTNYFGINGPLMFPFVKTCFEDSQTQFLRSVLEILTSKNAVSIWTTLTIWQIKILDWLRITEFGYAEDDSYNVYNPLRIRDDWFVDKNRVGGLTFQDQAFFSRLWYEMLSTGKGPGKFRLTGFTYWPYGYDEIRLRYVYSGARCDSLAITHDFEESRKLYNRNKKKDNIKNKKQIIKNINTNKNIKDISTANEEIIEVPRKRKNNLDIKGNKYTKEVEMPADDGKYGMKTGMTKIRKIAGVIRNNDAIEKEKDVEIEPRDSASQVSVRSSVLAQQNKELIENQQKMMALLMNLGQNLPGLDNTVAQQIMALSNSTNALANEVRRSKPSSVVSSRSVDGSQTSQEIDRLRENLRNKAIDVTGKKFSTVEKGVRMNLAQIQEENEEEGVLCLNDDQEVVLEKKVSRRGKSKTKIFSSAYDDLKFMDSIAHLNSRDKQRKINEYNLRLSEELSAEQNANKIAINQKVTDSSNTKEINKALLNKKSKIRGEKIIKLLTNAGKTGTAEAVSKMLKNSDKKIGKVKLAKQALKQDKTEVDKSMRRSLLSNGTRTVKYTYDDGTVESRVEEVLTASKGVSYVVDFCANQRINIMRESSTYFNSYKFYSPTVEEYCLEMCILGMLEKLELSDLYTEFLTYILFRGSAPPDTTADQAYALLKIIWRGLPFVVITDQQVITNGLGRQAVPKLALLGFYSHWHIVFNEEDKSIYENQWTLGTQITFGGKGRKNIVIEEEEDEVKEDSESRKKKKINIKNINDKKSDINNKLSALRELANELLNETGEESIKLELDQKDYDELESVDNLRTNDLAGEVAKGSERKNIIELRKLNKIMVRRLRREGRSEEIDTVIKIINNIKNDLDYFVLLKYSYDLCGSFNKEGLQKEILEEMEVLKQFVDYNEVTGRRKMKIKLLDLIKIFSQKERSDFLLLLVNLMVLLKGSRECRVVCTFVSIMNSILIGEGKDWRKILKIIGKENFIDILKKDHEEWKFIQEEKINNQELQFRRSKNLYKHMLNGRTDEKVDWKKEFEKRREGLGCNPKTCFCPATNEVSESYCDNKLKTAMMLFFSKVKVNKVESVEDYMAQYLFNVVGGSFYDDKDKSRREVFEELDRILKNVEVTKRTAGFTSKFIDLLERMLNIEEQKVRLKTKCHQKVQEQTKARTIYQTTILHYFVIGYLLAPIEHNIVNYNIFMNDTVFDMIKRISRRFEVMKGKFLNAFDFEDFNAQHSFKHMKMVLHYTTEKVLSTIKEEIVYNQYKKLASWAIEAIDHTYTVFEGKEIKWKAGLPTGVRYTSYMNNLLNYFYTTVAYENINETLGIEALQFNFEVCGDDSYHAFSSKELSIYFNNYMAAMGYDAQPSKQLTSSITTEFLRIQYYQGGLATGCLNRSISSLVCGNWESDGNYGLVENCEEIYNSYVVAEKRGLCKYLSKILFKESLHSAILNSLLGNEFDKYKVTNKVAERYAEMLNIWRQIRKVNNGGQMLLYYESFLMDKPYKNMFSEFFRLYEKNKAKLSLEQITEEQISSFSETKMIISGSEFLVNWAKSKLKGKVQDEHIKRSLIRSRLVKAGLTGAISGKESRLLTELLISEDLYALLKQIINVKKAGYLPSTKLTSGDLTTMLLCTASDKWFYYNSIKSINLFLKLEKMTKELMWLSYLDGALPRNSFSELVRKLTEKKEQVIRDNLLTGLSLDSKGKVILKYERNPSAVLRIWPDTTSIYNAVKVVTGRSEKYNAVIILSTRRSINKIILRI